jgi:hypothetical protein
MSIQSDKVKSLTATKTLDHEKENNNHYCCCISHGCNWAFADHNQTATPRDAADNAERDQKTCKHLS